MIFYLTNIFIFIVYSFFIYATIKNKKIVNKVVVFLFFIHFGSIMAFRSSNVGVDTNLYSELFMKIHYYDIKNMFSVINSAPLYVVYNKIISLISINPQAIIISNSIIIMLGSAIFIYRNSNNVILSIYYYFAFYFYFSSFNVSRQFIAIVLVANSYHYLKNNKFKKYLALVIAATCIHNTAIVGLVLLPLSKIKWTNRKIYLIAIVTGFFMFMYDKFLAIFLKIFPRYMIYMGGGKFSLSSTTEGKKILISFFYLLIIMICVFFLRYKNNSDNKKELYFLSSIMLIAVLIGIIFYKNLLLMRIELYFSFFSIIYIPKVINYISHKWTRVLMNYSLIIITLIPLVFQLHKNISGVVPYYFMN